MQIMPVPLFAVLMTLPFFLTVVALNVILVKPLREYIEGRDGAIHGARKEAAELESAASAKLDELETRLAAARQEAAQLRADNRRRGLDEERELLAAARAKADAEIADAIASITAETEGARAAIGQTAKNLSVDIAGRVLGRGLGA